MHGWETQEDFGLSMEEGVSSRYVVLDVDLRRQHNTGVKRVSRHDAVRMQSQL